MSDDIITIELNQDFHPEGVQLLPIGGDVTAPTFSGITDGKCSIGGCNEPC